ncbi:MAG: hypothetical protein RLZZ480_226 [Candidatus Parcubacteria bacterium]|jgi:hypothetical protein
MNDHKKNPYVRSDGETTPKNTDTKNGETKPVEKPVPPHSK